ncbi:bifunctional tryptophan synthase trp1 [Irineochytrium annulatum]|nr:bifunctional tryptophan synthase trp1 [Irineochytrium annulatum]
MSTILIDNYDSFTWNVYQYLSDLGANVIVYRNDEITVEALIALKPRNVVISPGPGHPRDAGISIATIEAFAGKVPILGVCLGEQSMYELYGGSVTHAGEIVHGKTSPVRHDGRGLFLNVPQGIEVTRYHSLAGDPATLPDCLEVTSWTPSGIVMGVRHRTFVMEGVQFHPESIASEEGMRMMANFLRWEGGTWDVLKVREELARWPKRAEEETVGARRKRLPSEAPTGSGGISISKIKKMNSTAARKEVGGKLTVGDAVGGEVKSPSILKVIEERRLRDVAEARALPGHTDRDLMRSLALGLAPERIDFVERIRSAFTPRPDEGGGNLVAVMAEIKRASPSKGSIDLDAHAPTQALSYANGGAAVISVLTEPTWFKGSLADLSAARRAVAHLPNRPAILRKDFVVDPYMIYEARLAGADTVLLIVAILEEARLMLLLNVARSLGMEPLTEVANEEEMRLAVKVGAKVIGVNNRDLHTFDVDSGRTVGLAAMVPDGVILVALSGITGRKDVERYLEAGARSVLVGESLMRSHDKGQFMRELRGLKAVTAAPSPGEAVKRTGKGCLIKICGVTRLEDAMAAVRGGASFIGLIFAEKSPRRVEAAAAKAIVDGVRKAFGCAGPRTLSLPPSTVAADATPTDALASTWYRTCESAIRHAVADGSGCPLFVGVFQDQAFEAVNRIIAEVGLDLAQLHGGEDESLLAPLLRVPAIRVIHVEEGAARADVVASVRKGSGAVMVGLLDTASRGVRGGTGTVFDWTVAKDVVGVARIPVWIAGGLAVNNVGEAIRTVRPWCVDIGSGVEKEKGIKDHVKVAKFCEEVARVNQEFAAETQLT